MGSIHALAAVALAFLVAGCGAPQQPAVIVPEGAGMTLQFDIHLMPGEEASYCQYVPVAPEGEYVKRFQHEYTRGSHHLSLFSTSVSTPPQPGIFSCGGAGPSVSDLFVAGLIYGDQVTSGELAYPPGVALHLDTSKLMLLQTHYLNAGTEPLDAHVSLRLDYTDKASVVEEAGSAMFYHPTVVATPGMSKVGEHCPITKDIDIGSLISHMHRRGVGEKVWIVEPDGHRTDLYSTTEWSAPSPGRYSPPRHVAAGSAIEYECTFENDDGIARPEGQSAEKNEMCVVVPAYWPRIDALTEQCKGPGAYVFGYGQKSCTDTMAGYFAANEWSAGLGVIHDACPASAQAVTDLFLCIGADRTFACGHFDEACWHKACPTQWTACAAAACGP